MNEGLDGQGTQQTCCASAPNWGGRGTPHDQTSTIPQQINQNVPQFVMGFVFIPVPNQSSW